MRKRRRCFILGGVVLVFCLFIYLPILLLVETDEMDIWNITRDMTVFVRPNNYTVTVDAASACDGTDQGERVFLLVVVCSAATNFENRMAIRETWGRQDALEAEPRDFSSADDTGGSSNSTVTMMTATTNSASKNGSSVRKPRAAVTVNSANQARQTDSSNIKSDNVTADAVRLVFMLGRTDNSTIQTQIVNEASKYGDVVQEDFLDTYNNLTIKSVMMLKWVNTTCHGVRYVMKSDDDTFVNVPRLVSYLRKNGRPSLLLGCLICSAVPVKDKTSKWYTSKSLFAERVYPNYLSGTGYVISGDLIPRLYAAALDTPFFHLEDIFVTGICARRLRVKPVDYEGFTYQKRPLNPCLYHVTITGHKVSAADTRFMWKEMYAEGLQCTNASQIKLRSFKPSKCF